MSIPLEDGVVVLQDNQPQNGIKQANLTHCFITNTTKNDCSATN